MQTVADVLFAVAFLFAADPPRIEETIVVTAERLEQPWEESTASVTVLARDEIETLPAKTLGDALELVPGLQLIGVNPGAPPMISSRGFFGAGEVEYVQLLIDGVPAADVESGLADWRQIPIEDVDHIEVLRGAGSSLFGDTALAGVVQVFRRPQSHASATVGGFETARWSASYASEAFHIGASGARSEGFRDHSESRELFASLGLERGRVKATLDLSDRDRDDPGARDAAEMESDPFGSNEIFASDRDDSRRVRASLRWSGAFDALLHAHDRSTTQTRTLLLAPGFADRATREVDTRGLGGSVTKTWTLARGRVAGGADLAHESLRSDYDAEVRGDGSRRRGAAFVSGEWRITSKVRLAAGARFDSTRDEFESEDASDNAFSPRVGVAFDHGAVTTYVQLARAFKAPTLDQRFDQRPRIGISNPALVPQRSKNVEAGARGAEWEVVAYLIDVEDEIDFDIRTFRYQNIGSSRHRGVEAMWRPRSRGRFAPRVTYAWTRVGSGEIQLKNIAEHVIRAGVDMRALVDVHLDVEHSANRWLDDDNLFPLGDATVVDLRVARTFGALTAAIESTNLFDEQYAPLGFALGDAPYYYPAAGRSVAVTLTWRESR